MVPVAPRRVYGVATSVADDAGTDLWVCRATPGADGIRVESVEPVAAMPGGAVQRDEALRVLLGKILEVPRSAWGLDAPLSAAPAADPGPAPAAEASVFWRDLLGAAKEARDQEAFGQWLSTNGASCRSGGIDRLYHVARAITIPVRASGTGIVLPLDPLPMVVAGMPTAMLARLPSIYLMEVAPDRVVEELAARGADLPLIDEAASAGDRDRLVRALVAAGQVRPVTRTLRGRIADPDEGRGLRALLCAIAAWRGYRSPEHLRLRLETGAGHAGHAYR